MQEYVAKLEDAAGQPDDRPQRTAQDGTPLRSSDALEEIDRILRGGEDDS